MREAFEGDTVDPNQCCDFNVYCFLRSMILKSIIVNDFNLVGFDFH